MIYNYYPTEESALNLLIFLNGWGMTEAAIRHLAIPDGFDFLVGCDYRSLEEPLPISLEKYDTIWLAAWSTGVWAAEQLARRDLLKGIDRAIAMAGSPFIRNDFFGIPEKLFDQTLAQFNDANREVFNRLMCGGKSLQHLFREFSARSTEELKIELRNVQIQEVKQKKERTRVHIPWEKALVARKDRIIPFQNLAQFWRERGVRAILLPQSDHYFFDSFTSWQELFDL